MSQEGDVGKTCVFCEIVAGNAPVKKVWDSPSVMGIEPLSPHAPGHVLFLPRVHVRDATENVSLTADVMEVASVWAAGMGAANIVTSVGRAATQTVMHLHIHVIPRSEHDGLHSDWPWCRSDVAFEG